MHIKGGVTQNLLYPFIKGNALLSNRDIVKLRGNKKKNLKHFQKLK